MKQASESVTAEGLSEIPEGLNWLVCGISPSGTLDACSGVVRLMGQAVDSINHNGSSFGDNEADAVLRILGGVADALAWESKRVQYRRKPESEVRAAQGGAA